MNEVISAMQQRRSIRKFKPDMPAEEDLEQIVDAGLYAPSGMGKQSPVIICVTNKKVRDSLSDINRRIGGWPEGFDPFYGAPAIMIVLAPKDNFTYIYDGSLTMGNMMNAAYSLGLGSIWIHRAKEEFEMPEWQEFLKALGIEGEYEGIGHCAVGYADGKTPSCPPRREGRTFFVE